MQSHGIDNMPPSPPRRGSGPLSLSPIDCRTLRKLLSDVGRSSPLATPSPLEPSKQLSTSTDPTSSAVHSGAKEENFHRIRDEVAYTDYEDEDDSMELSEGEQDSTTGGALHEPDELASPIVSTSDIRLRESVTTHDEIEKLKYARQRRWSATKAPKIKRSGRKYQQSNQEVGGDTIEDVVNIPGKLASAALPQDLGRRDSNRPPVSEDVERQNRMRLSVENILENERTEQENATSEGEPGVFISKPDIAQQETSSLSEQQAIQVALKADKKEDVGADGAFKRHGAEVSNLALKQHCLYRHSSKESQNTVQSAMPETASVGAIPQPTRESALLVTNTPSTAVQAPDRNRIQVATNQNVPETPFTKTLSYFKQYKGPENSPTKRRRTTALPQEIGDLIETANDHEEVADSAHPKQLQHNAADNASMTTLPVGAAVADLIDMAHSHIGEGSKKLEDHADEGDQLRQVSTLTIAAVENTSTESEHGPESGVDDNQKQLILHPQHPAIVNAIGLIPATMFWATAAPVVKYTSIAVDLLIDKLRDIYLEEGHTCTTSMRLCITMSASLFACGVCESMPKRATL